MPRGNIKLLCALLMMDSREPKGNFSTINLCQFLYAITSGSKIGASNLIRQLGYEQSLQCLDPDHLPFLDDENLACSLTDCIFQPILSHAILLAGAKSVLKVLGEKTPCWCTQMICQVARAVFSVLVTGPFAPGMGVVKHTIPSLWESSHVLHWQTDTPELPGSLS